MQANLETPDVGVIVGRFQVHELHSEHKKLIDTVCENHDKVIIFLGLSPVINSSTDPLDFEARKQMILEDYSDVNVLYIKDTPSDLQWSRSLDAMIGDILHANQTALLYGGRDSFIDHYEGRFPTRELEPEVILSGSAFRKAIASRKTRAQKAFREGVIWASLSRFKNAYPTVDVAPFRIVDGKKIQILMGRKDHEDKFRFIGGFVDPEIDNSYEDAARREAVEEANVVLGRLYPGGSRKQDDWRYRRTPDKIFTTFYIAEIKGGTPAPGDDIVELKWFDFDELMGWYDKGVPVVDTHVPLLGMLRATSRGVPSMLKVWDK